MGQMTVGDLRGGQWLFSQAEKARLNVFPSVLTQIQSKKSKVPKPCNGLLCGVLLTPDLFLAGMHYLSTRFSSWALLPPPPPRLPTLPEGDMCGRATLKGMLRKEAAPKSFCLSLGV